MKTKPHLVAANDPGRDKHVSQRLAWALDMATGPATLQERRFLIEGELFPVWLQPDLWLALDGIAQLEGVMTAHIVERIAHRRRRMTLPAAIRTFILAFHRQK